MDLDTISRESREPKYENKSTILVLRQNNESQWCLRNDMKRAIIYEMIDNGRTVSKVGILHPSHALILALFNGKRTLGDISKVAAYLFEKPENDADDAVKSIISKWKEALIEKTDASYSSNYDPRDFILEASNIDLHTPRLYKPLMLAFRLSDDCMRDCIYCNVQKRQTEALKFLPLGRWEELADETREMGILSVTISGGDPFMHKDIVKILSLFTFRNIKLFVSTKSYISAKKAAQLARNGLRDIQFSIDAPIPEVADYLTNAQGFFLQATESIRNLIKSGIRVNINAILTSYNVLLAPMLVDLLEDLGVSKITLSTYGRSMYSHSDEFFVNERAGRWLEKIINDAKRPKVKYNYYRDDQSLTPGQKEEDFKQRAVCTASRWGFVILSDGKVIPCDEFPADDRFLIGDVTNKSIMEVWNAPANMMFTLPPRDVFKGTVCYECPEFEACTFKGKRCIRDSFKAYGTIFTAPPSCPRAAPAPRMF
jgi:radical SAM protein with 4Fe4S-binding SPASM domain